MTESQPFEKVVNRRCGAAKAHIATKRLLEAGSDNQAPRACTSDFVDTAQVHDDVPAFEGIFDEQIVGLTGHTAVNDAFKPDDADVCKFVI